MNRVWRSVLSGILGNAAEEERYEGQVAPV